MRRRASRPAALASRHAARPPIPLGGGFTFAEQPETEAPDARVIWRADLDPGTLRVTAEPIDPGHPEALDLDALVPWMTIVRDAIGEHVVLSDGWHHIRLDVVDGTLTGQRAALLRYELAGMASVEPRILPLRRLLDLNRRRRFSASLYPVDRRIDRWILVLRVHDALTAGVSHSEIARVLFQDDPSHFAGARRSDSLRSRVRRLVVEARRLANGEYRLLLQRRD